MQHALEKYEHFSATQFPNYSQYEAWVGADLMIKGLELSGKSPTRASVIKDLRGLKAYNASGLLPTSFNYSTNFGHNPPVNCSWFPEGDPDRFLARQCEAHVRWISPRLGDGLVVGRSGTQEKGQ